MDSTPLTTYRVVYTTTASIAILLNLVIIVSSIRSGQTLSQTSLITFWLCCFDFLVASTDFIIGATSLSLHQTIANQTIPPSTTLQICHIHGFLHILGGSTSLLLCLALTLSRYSIIIHKRTISRKITLTSIAIILLFASTVASLPFIMTDPNIYTLHPSNLYCATDWSQKSIKSRVLTAINLLTVIPPVTFIGFAYWKMYHVVSLQCRRASGVFREARLRAEMKGRSGEDEGGDYPQDLSIPVSTMLRTSSSTVVEVHQALSYALEDEALQEEQRLLLQSWIIVLAFLSGWSPYLIVMIYEAIMTKSVSAEYDFVAIYCTLLNQGFNPVILIAYKRDVRERVVKMISGQSLL
ncbi:family A G protein-coupled receptor-like protein [Rhizoclosmatium globosum]|uniref:Family A G protein-coupled receptor-like protein n=1 Tax=Rhizoclosmatium globosum TaxID=329046 RepID=A0A1Y2BCB2_9FUNG|nr:family A G protein-coupled receptor-like protein [Rhizoclosmatium globosum]|eukprot:ORY32468.1 family A G protein-coupled receptor-like protein [Rhizoclosmatium globosum]